MSSSKGASLRDQATGLRPQPPAASSLSSIPCAWQPIETAPTNDSVLVFIANAEHYGHGIYRAMQVDMGTGRRWMTSGLHIGRDCGADTQPTHWMPLPEPPEA